MKSYKARILIVDDNRSLVRIYGRLLQEEGYDILTAFDGETGLQKAVTEKPDLIILDIMMPRMDGYKVCRRLQRHPDAANIPVLMLTRKGRVDSRPGVKHRIREREEGFDAGAVDFLSKPVKAKELLDRVKSLLWLGGI